MDIFTAVYRASYVAIALDAICILNSACPAYLSCALLAVCCWYIALFVHYAEEEGDEPEPVLR